MLHSEQRQKQAFEQGASVFYYYGSDGFLPRSAAQKQLSVLEDENGEVTQLDGPAPTVEELVAAAGTISFFGTRRLVYLTEFQPSAYSEKDFAEVCDLIGQLENAIVVAYSIIPQERGRMKLNKQTQRWIALCEQFGYAGEVAMPNPQQLRNMLSQRAASMNTKLTDPTAGILLERCGQDLFLLQNEVDKLAAASGYTEITPGLVAELATQNLEADVFDMVRLITQKNATKACQKLHLLLEMRNEPIAITAALIGSYVDLYRVKAGQVEKHGYAQVHKDFSYKGSDYRLKKSAETASRYTLSQLQRCIAILMELDLGLKGNPTSGAIQLETALCRLAMAGIKA